MGVAEVVATLRAETGEFTAKMGEAQLSVERLAKGGSGNFEKLASVGKIATLALGAAVVGVAVASVDLADKYQQATTSIAANGDISVAAANKIGTAFLGTAGTTIYSAQNIATSFAGVAGQVKEMNGGVLNATAAMAVMKPAMDLAEASGTSLSNATSDVSNTLQAFGLKITQSPLVANVLFNAARDTGTNVDALSGQLDKMRAKMGTAAPPIQQMGGLLVDLAQHGETGRAALSTLGSAFTGIVSPTAAVTKAQQAMGVSFVNATGQLDPMQQIIGELGPKIAGMGNAQAATTLKSLGFGSAALKLVGVIQAGPAAFDKATAAVSRQNSAHEAAEKQAQTLQHQIELVKATVEDYGVKIGQALLPKLESLLKIGLKVTEWALKHKEVLIALAVVVGGVLLAAMGAFIASLFTAGGALAVLISPIGVVIAAVALLAAGVVLVISHWSAISGFFVGLWHDVEHAFSDAISFVVGIIKGWWPLILGIMTGGIGLLPALLVKYWSQIKSDVLQYWNDIVSFFQQIPAKILAFFQSAGSWLLNIGHDIIHGLWNGIVAGWTALGNIEVTVGGWIINALSNAATWLLQTGENIVQGLWNGISSMGSWLYGKVSGFATSFVKGAIHDALSIFSPSKVMYDAGVNVALGLANGILSGAGIVGSASQKLANAATVGVSGNFNAGITPISAGATAGGGNGTAMLTANISIDGQTFMTAIQPAVVQYQRSFSAPVFGTTR